MRTRTPAIALATIFAGATVLTACGQEDAPVEVGAGGAVPSVASDTLPESDDPVPPVPPVDAAVPSERIDEATLLLAKQLDANSTEITVVRGFPVEWRDGALGCEEKDMGYIQALQPGYYLELAVGDETYGFHGKDGTVPFYCETPSEPITPAS